MECKCCETKTRYRNEEEKEMLIKHLNRINGQINGIKQMVEDSRYCDDILTQVSAAESSIRSLGLALLNNHLHTFVKDSLTSGDDSVIDEVMKTIERFSR